MTIPLEKSGPDEAGSGYLRNLFNRVKRQLEKPRYNPVDA